MQREFPKNDVNRKILYLILWFVLFIIIALIIMLPKRPDTINNTVTENKTTSREDDDTFEIPVRNEAFNLYTENKNKLLNKNFDFKYTYNGPEGITIYTGTASGTSITYTKEDAQGLNKYLIENDILYSLLLDKKTVVSYEINHETYLDINYLLDNIDETSLVMNENVIDFSLNDGYGKMFIDNNLVSKIEVYVDITTYTLEFLNIK